MNEIEALADAIMTFEGWHYDTRSWRNRNPGNLRGSGFPHTMDSDNYCVFASLDIGWEALLYDLKSKLHGSHGLTPDSTLVDLLNIYAPAGDNNNPGEYAKFVASYLTNFLPWPVTPTSKLSIFI